MGKPLLIPAKHSLDALLDALRDTPAMHSKASIQGPATALRQSRQQDRDTLYALPGMIPPPSAAATTTSCWQLKE
ncbi:hypothetical protein UMZ34_00525 [Halopseudomonas pachastrellae]|nr:hypothetical protein UMZ34_00525 [Halopseudomonas pachastrellae]